MKFGVRIPNLVLKRYFPFIDKLDFETVKEWALESERLDYHSIWINDHIVFGSNLECWTTLSALSTLTKRVRFGPLVLCNNFRSPSMVAKMAATLDFISDGRLEFGIGAGWNEFEHRSYGIPLPPPRIRMERLKEALEIIKKMWTKEKVSYEGKHYRLEEAICDPKPIQKPHPPIMIGSSGEKVGLKLVAKYADKHNIEGRSPSETSRKLGILREHCSKVGRNYDEIEKSWWGRVCIAKDPLDVERLMKRVYILREEKMPFNEWLQKAKANSIVGTSEECIEKIREYMDVGITFIIAKFEDIPITRGLRLFADKVIPNI